MTSIKRGDISQMSFGFTVADAGDEWLEKDGEIKRTITEVKELFDVSPVVFPAYKSTRISVRTAEKVEEIKKNSAETRGVTAEEDKSLREYEQLKEMAKMVENYGGLRK
jgi:phage head maturation protease